MVFNSFSYWAFFAAIFVLSRCCSLRARNILLLLASYLFYAAWDYRFLSLLWLSTGVDFLVGLRLASTPDPRRRRAWLVLSLVVNLGVLGFFKYAGFFAEGLVALLDPAGIRLAPWALEVVLPVGISFYTFQSLSYTIDVYRGRLAVERSLSRFALYVAFFPQLVAGPIERATRLLPQIGQLHRAGIDQIASGAWLCLWGLFKKVVIADNVGVLPDAVFADPGLASGPEVLVATYAFSIQIYCDFSGYTDIARGSARLLGFDLMRNFDTPYLSRSMQEFWRRWHISLSTWLRDYLYIPLGGSRLGARRTYVNLGITMLLGGLWHGANWTFLLWGTFHGALLAIERGWKVYGKESATGRFRQLLRLVATFHLVVFGWLIFRADAVGDIPVLLSRFSDLQVHAAGSWFLQLLLLSSPLVVFDLFQWWRDTDDEFILSAPLLVRGLVYFGLMVAIVFLGNDGGENFIYFQF
jgi:D-alanyl-lipoteichoic acid acyltransferase DltB (MBOAT superfamily)